MTYSRASGRKKMITHEEKTPLDEVLNEFVAQSEQPTAEVLEAFSKRYPRYRDELIEFAAAWAEQLVLPPVKELTADQEKVLVDRAMSHATNVTFNRDQGAQGVPEGVKTIGSLTDEAKRMGFSVPEFAEACGLDLALITKLNNRQIRPDTIPSRLISHMAQLIERTTLAVEEYLDLPPGRGTAIAYLSRKKPESTNQQGFADAMKGSSLSNAEKARWLDKPKGPGDI